MASGIKAPAPGARGAKLCGIWSLIASATCIGIPIGLVLAIIALVKQAKANRLAKENPDLYELPTNTGLVTGIFGLAMPVVILPFLGIVSAIAIPAFLTQRDNARIPAMNAVFEQVTERAQLLEMEEPMPSAESAARTLSLQAYRNPYTGKNACPVLEEHPQHPGEIAIFVRTASQESGSQGPELVVRACVKTGISTAESEARIPWAAPTVTFEPLKP